MKTVKVINTYEFDDLVEKTYGKHYCFQQQDGCKPEGTVFFNIPTRGTDYARDSIPEVVNGDIIGVSFKAWLERDIDQGLSGTDDDSPWDIIMFWTRSFYPHPDILLNDLHSKGLIPAGNLVIDISR
jgi:hypothetical protein